MNLKTIATLACLVSGFGACTKSEEPDKDTGLPPDTDTEDTDTGSPIIPDDTGQPAEIDQVPENWLNLYQDGYWTLSPHGGPYTAFVGQMVALELFDVTRPEKSDTDTDTDTGFGFDTGEDSPIICRTEYNLIGYPLEDGTESCASCTFTFQVEFNVVDGDPSLCRDPELPKDKDIRVLGFDETSNTIQYDYYGSGFWLPWYNASLTGNTLTFDWSARVGLSVEMEDN